MLQRFCDSIVYKTDGVWFFQSVLMDDFIGAPYEVLHFQSSILNRLVFLFRNYRVKVSYIGNSRGTLVGLCGFLSSIGFDFRLADHIASKVFASRGDKFVYRSKRSDRLRISFYYK